MQNVFFELQEREQQALKREREIALSVFNVVGCNVQRFKNFLELLSVIQEDYPNMFLEHLISTKGSDIARAIIYTEENPIEKAEKLHQYLKEIVQYELLIQQEVKEIYEQCNKNYRKAVDYICKNSSKYFIRYILHLEEMYLKDYVKNLFDRFVLIQDVSIKLDMIAQKINNTFKEKTLINHFSELMQEYVKLMYVKQEQVNLDDQF